MKNILNDKTGNLIEDKSEQLKIHWTYYNKLRQIDSANSTKLKFRYDALGNRIMKDIVNKSKEIYVRDAQGNAIVLYEIKNDSLLSKEYYIYGTNRIGYMEDKLYIGKKMSGKNISGVIGMPTSVFSGFPNPFVFPGTTSVVPVYFGSKRYELSDWLGNVRVVINNKKTPVNTGSVTISYRPQVVSVMDYYSFGSEIRERSYEYNNKYRFGFQKQEKDDEIYGKGNAYYFKFREHDARIGRFWSVDPLAAKYPHNSPYAFAMNRVIDGIELEGLEWSSSGKYINYLTGRTEIQYTVKIIAVDANDVVISGYTSYVKNIMAPGAEEIFQNQKTAGTFDDPDIKFKIVIDDNATIKLKFVDKLYKNANAESYFNNPKVNEIKISLNNINKKINKNPARTLAHELGHTAGLKHPWEIKDDEPTPQKDIQQKINKLGFIENYIDIKNNLMNSEKNQLIPTNEGTQTTEGQRKTIEQNINNNSNQ